MTKKCYWGTKDADAHISQCLTSCHNPKVRADVTDEFCEVCKYDEPLVIKTEAENEAIRKAKARHTQVNQYGNNSTHIENIGTLNL